MDMRLELGQTSDAENAATPPPRRFGSTMAALVVGAILGVVIALAAVYSSAAPHRSEFKEGFVVQLAAAASAEQHIWIMRHGDKYSSYPACPKEKPLCFNETLMGVNPPLTPCGVKQAEFTADWLKANTSSFGGISNIVVSPFTRTLQTALPLAKALNLTLKVEYLLSEAMQPQGPFQPYNAGLDASVVKQLQEIEAVWDTQYGSPPIPTPETPKMYDARVEKAAKVLKKRFPPSSGNLAIYTHATTSFSIAYGLCHGEDSSDASLKKFVESQAAIAPVGVIHVVLDSAGKCKRVDQTNNVALKVGCGKTTAFKCNFTDFPAWYWRHSDGAGPGKCA